MESGTPLIGLQKSFVIPNGSNVSNSVAAVGGNNGQLMVYGKTVTDGAITYKYQVSPNDAEWYDLVDSTATVIVPPLEGIAKALNEIAAYYRIKSSANVTAARTWNTTAEL